MTGGHSMRLHAAGLALVAVLASAAAHAQSVDKHVFAPPECEFSTTFPMVPDVKVHHAPSGGQALQATSPGDGLPIMVAQCTTGDDGSAPPDVDDRLARVRSTIEGRHGRAITTSTPKDARGDWAIAAGEVAIGGHPLMMTTASIAGRKSMLLLTVLRDKSSDPALVDRFIAGVVRHADAPAP